jgi:hypothetical protein
VSLTIAAAEARQLPVHDVPESAELEPEAASRTDRLRTEIEHLTGEDRTNPNVRQLTPPAGASAAPNRQSGPRPRPSPD